MVPALNVGKTTEAGRDSNASIKKNEANKFGIPTKMPTIHEARILITGSLLKPFIPILKSRAVKKTHNKKIGL